MKMYQVIGLIIVLCLAAACGQNTAIQPRMRACTYDTQCIDNAYCKDQSYCQCKQDYIFNISPDGVYSCLKEASQLDDPCVEHVQCNKPFGVEALCVQGNCQCKSTAHFIEGRCYETSKLGGKCKVSNNCKIDSDIPVSCYGSICVCPQGHHPNSLNTDCQKSAMIGDLCTNDYNCVINSSRCVEVCRCKLGYVVSEDKMRCLKAADQVGDHCLENAQCNEFLQNMRCLKGTCFCQAHYHSVPATATTCWRDVGLREHCTDSNECIVTSNNPLAVHCAQGFCKCQPGYQQDSNDPQDCSVSSGNEIQIVRSLLLLSLLLIRLRSS